MVLYFENSFTVIYQTNFAKKSLENGLVNYRERGLGSGVSRCQGVFRTIYYRDPLGRYKFFFKIALKKL